MSKQLALDHLRSAVAGDAVAIRRIQRLQPAGGSGDKVFPSTYEGGDYALEKRVIDGERMDCVLLDSVQSQANRIESALEQAFFHGAEREADIPIVVVDFRHSKGVEGVGLVTSLGAPHRLADAILRDAVQGKTRFRDLEEGKVLDTASVSNATGLYSICPTALIFGLWDSTGPKGGLGTKFQRALVSEIIGVDVEGGVKPTSRIDPLSISLAAGPVYQHKSDQAGWTLEESEAAKEKGKPVLFGSRGKPSEINHGNVTPSLKDDSGRLHPGGVSLRYAQQTVVLSLPALRKLQFPDGRGELDPDRGVAARTALAALAIAGAQLSIDQGCDLRSRCLLVPEPGYVAAWQIVRSDGSTEEVSVKDPVRFVHSAVEAATRAHLPPWRRKPTVLTPSASLAALVLKSIQAAAAPADQS